MLAAVVDAELLAVHAAVHDALAGRVRGPVAAYLPGAWLPHCVLAVSRPAEAFAALHPWSRCGRGSWAWRSADRQEGPAAPGAPGPRDDGAREDDGREHRAGPQVQ